MSPQVTGYWRITIFEHIYKYSVSNALNKYIKKLMKQKFTK